MEEDKGITITYETLFELLRREKDRLELQKLDSSFFVDVASYLQEKNNLVQNKEGQTELFSEDEKLKTHTQLINLKRILRELYERREKKIISMAVDKSRTKSNLIDISALLDKEKALFNSLVEVLDMHRGSIILKLLNGEQPVEVKKPSPAVEPGVDNGKEKINKEEPAQPDKPTRLIRFKHAVPKFVGLEGEEFGPFEEEDIASLPKEIASVLINKGRAGEIKEG